jgi:protein tyrosine phosphatase
MIKLYKALRFLALFFILITIVIAARLAYLEEQGNFHIVTKGELYRSAQLDKDELTHYIKKYRIKSVVNLIGKSNDKQYKQELKACKRLNIIHYDYGFSATNMLSIKRMKEIVLLLKKLPKPILIHCKAGADRSGLVAAIWLYKVKHYPFKKAFNQLSVIFGHFPYLGSPTVAMDKSFIELKMAKIDKKGDKYE